MYLQWLILLEMIHLSPLRVGWRPCKSSLMIPVRSALYGILSYRTPGRPRKDVSIDDIMELRGLNYKWSKIATILGISRATLYRRLEEGNVTPDDHAPLSNDQLDEIISSIKKNHPNDGEVLMKGHLLRLGIRTTRQALRDSIHRVDHVNVIARRRFVMRRRIYSVPHPNYMWHIDTHHKLIKWRYVIHGGIDGFSRTITYLGCANNNRSSTAFEYFLDSTSLYGLPNHVRSDCGGENVSIWRYMISSHNNDYSSVLTGSSVHNERVERLWRDVHRCVAIMYADIFRSLESELLLDPLNEVDLYCLHNIFLPRINRCLLEFKESWNHHALSSEGNMSPYQLLFEGLNHIASNTNDHVVNSTTTTDLDVSSLLGSHVEVPRMHFVPCSLLLQDLHSINPLQISVNNGVDLYRAAIHSAGEHLNTGCDLCVINSL